MKASQAKSRCWVHCAADKLAGTRLRPPSTKQKQSLWKWRCISKQKETLTSQLSPRFCRGTTPEEATAVKTSTSVASTSAVSYSPYSGVTEEDPELWSFTHCQILDFEEMLLRGQVYRSSPPRHGRTYKLYKATFFTGSLNTGRLRCRTAKPYVAILQLRRIRDSLLRQRLPTGITKAHEQNQIDIR